jgi:hypothetical protein
MKASAEDRGPGILVLKREIASRMTGEEAAAAEAAVATVVQTATAVGNFVKVWKTDRMPESTP